MNIELFGHQEIRLSCTDSLISGKTYLQCALNIRKFRAERIPAGQRRVQFVVEKILGGGGQVFGSTRFLVRHVPTPLHY